MNASRHLSRALCVVTLSLSAFAYAQSYKIAIGQVPTTEFYKNLAAAIGDVSGAKLDVQIVPIARSAYLAEKKQVDIALPMLAMKDPVKIKALGYDYSTSVICQNAFVLVTNKSKPVDIEDLKKGNTKGYKIEADVSMANQFEFAALPSTNPEASMKKISDGSIDGYIHGQAVTDAAIKASKATNLKRQLYENLDLVFTLQKGGRGGNLDKMLTDSIKKLKDSGRYDQVMGPLIKALTYNDWQP